MSGIWERVSKEHPAGAIGINQVKAALVQEATGMYADIQIKDKIDARLAIKGHPPLDAAEIADLVALAAVVAAISGADNKLVWLAQLDAMLVDAEMGLCTELEFRTQMGITL